MLSVLAVYVLSSPHLWNCISSLAEDESSPIKLWLKAAGLGRMGIHRSLIHPKYGSFVLLGTVLIAEDVDTASASSGL